MSNTDNQKNNVSQEDLIDRAEYRLRKAYDETEEAAQTFYQRHKYLFWLLVLLIIAFVVYHFGGFGGSSSEGSSASAPSAPAVAAPDSGLVEATQLKGGALRYPSVETPVDMGTFMKRF